MHEIILAWLRFNLQFGTDDYEKLWGLLNMFKPYCCFSQNSGTELKEEYCTSSRLMIIIISNIDILSFSITFMWYRHIDTTSIGCGAPALLDSPKLRCSSFKMKTQTFFYLCYLLPNFSIGHLLDSLIHIPLLSKNQKYGDSNVQKTYIFNIMWSIYCFDFWLSWKAGLGWELLWKFISWSNGRDPISFSEPHVNFKHI